MKSFLISVWFAAFAFPAYAQDVATPPRSFQDCPECPLMVVLPAGKFLMGSPAGEPGRFDAEGPQHVVTVPSFAMSKDDVTVAQFATFVKATGYEMGPCTWPKGVSWRSPGLTHVDDKPVVCVSWQDAEAYVAWINTKRPGVSPYRLPSEAEWEYAARGGTTTARWWGDSLGTGNANCNGCGSVWDNKDVAPAGSFPANPFGLNDMLGNVWQWTNDCWNESYLGAPHDGRSWTTGDCTKRVLRGGSWSNLPAIIRTASRSRGNEADRDADYASYTGFRVVRALP